MNNESKVTVSTPTETEVTMTRTFNASRESLFAAWIQPEVLKQWRDTDGSTLLRCEIDLRVNGAWRFVTRQPDGSESGQHGVFREVVPNERIVNTELWEDTDIGEMLVIATFEDEGAATKLTSTIRFPSREIRDLLLESGMENGFSESCDRLESFLASESTNEPH